MAGDGEHTSIGLLSQELSIRSYDTPAVANQDRVQVPHLKHAKSGPDDSPDLGYIVSLSGLRAQRFGEINAPNTNISKRANSTVTGIGVIAGGILVAFMAILLLGVLPCYLKRRRARLQKPNVVDAENGTVTQIRHHKPDNGETPFAKPLGHVKEESIGSVYSLSLASSETAVPMAESGERRRPPLLTLPVGSLPLSPSTSVRRFGDGTGETVVIAPPPRLLLRPGSADNDRDRGQLVDSAPAPVRSRSVRFAGPGRNGRATPTSAQSFLTNPWDGGEGAPPLSGLSPERVRLFHLPPVPESAPPGRPSRRAHSLRATGLPRNPRDLPVSLRDETRSLSIHESVSDQRRSFADARRPVRPL